MDLNQPSEWMRLAFTGITVVMTVHGVSRIAKARDAYQRDKPQDAQLWFLDAICSFLAGVTTAVLALQWS